MGSTVTVGKAATAIEVNGKISYVLFENTFEKNVYPHTPRWNCIYVGDINGAIKQVCRYASATVGGMLVGRGGWIRPEGYIQSWLEELANPFQLQDQIIQVEVSSSFRAAIPIDGKEEGINALLSVDRHDLVELVESGNSFSLSLTGDINVVHALFGPGCISPWRAFSATMLASCERRNSELGYRPKAVKGGPVRVPDCIALDQDSRLVRDEHGIWRSGGWTYEIVQRFVADLWEAELREPGNHRTWIRAFRKAITDAPQAPDGLKFSINREAASDRHQVAEIESFAKRYPVFPTATGFEATITDDNRGSVQFLPRGCVTWLVDGPSQGTKQLALF